MHWREWVALALAFAVVICAVSGCEGQKILCSSNSDCPLGLCDTTLGKCVLKSCSTDQDCAAGTFCNASMGKLCTLIPDGGEDMSCAPLCPIYQVCRATVCYARYSGIAITQPVPNQYVDAGSATVVAQLVVAPGNARADPSFLTLTLGLPDGGTAGSGGLPIQSAGLYSGPLNPAFDGPYILTASYTDAGLTSPQVAITLDRIPPAFVVVVPSHGRTGIYVDPTQPTAWRRDDMVTLSIQSPEPNMVPSSVRVAVTGLGGSGPTLNVDAGSGCGPGQNYCGTVTLDMAAPTMRAFNGTYVLQVSGQDLAGNTGTSPGGIGVTRWNWRFPAGGPQSKTTPAIGNTGTIYFATTNSIDTGTVYALNPDAGVKWSMALGAVEGSLAVGESSGGPENVYVAVNDATSTTIRALNGNTGAEVARCGSFAGAIRASVAVTKSIIPPDPLRESAFGVVSGSPYRMAALRPGVGGSLGCADAGFTGNVQTPGAVAVDNLNNVYLGDNAANAVSYNFDGGWKPRTNWPVSTAPFNINAPTISGTTVVAGATAVGPPRGQILSILTSGVGGVNWHFPPTPANFFVWNPAVLAGGISNGGIAVYGDDFPNLTEIAVTAPSSSAVARPSAPIMATPAIGQGNVIYTVDTGGTVAAWSSDLSSTLWSVSPAGGSGVGPALDCSRNATGMPIPGRPGVLYVVTNSGSLFSFVVDSRGINTGAPWPKYQHDPRNTGNQQTPLAPFACP
jgi:hypothetical protein